MISHHSNQITPEQSKYSDMMKATYMSRNEAIETQELWLKRARFSYERQAYSKLLDNHYIRLNTFVVRERKYAICSVCLKLKIPMNEWLIRFIDSFLGNQSGFNVVYYRFFRTPRPCSL